MRSSLFALLVLAIGLDARPAATLAQTTAPRHPAAQTLPPGRTIVTNHAKAEASQDSAFHLAFQKLVPMLQLPSVAAEANAQFVKASKIFSVKRIDSAAAYAKFFHALDTAAAARLAREVYQKEFSAPEIRSIAGFLATPAGKHYDAVQNAMAQRVQKATNEYVTRTLQTTLAAMMPRRRPTVKEADKGTQEGSPATPGAATKVSTKTAPKLAPSASKKVAPGASQKGEPQKTASQKAAPSPANSRKTTASPAPKKK